MDAIASRADVSKQTVYSRFKSKQELFVACIESKLEEYQLERASLPMGLPLVEGLTAIGDAYLRLLCDPGVRALWRLMIANAAGHPEAARILYESGPVRGRESLARFLESHAQKESLIIEDYTVAAQVFFALVRGEYQTQLLLNLIEKIPEQARRAHVADAIQQFLKIYRT